MYGYIYKIVNLKNNKIYIGKHKYNKPELDESYIASGITIKRSIAKYGIENFQRELIDIAETLEELNNKEKYWISYYNSLSPNGYNLTSGGDGMSEPSLEVREKMASRKLGTKQSEETKNKKNNKLKNCPHTKEWVEKISKALKGQKVPEKCIQGSKKRLSNTHWYNNGIEENRYKPEDVPKGWSRGRLNGYYPSSLGYHHTQEHNNEISKRMSKVKWFNNGIKEIRLTTDVNIPEGFIPGRLKIK